MKKWMKITLIVLSVLIAFNILAGLLGLRVNPFAVEKIELYSYDFENDEEYRVELTEGEIWMVSMLYNLSVPTRKLYADAPPMNDRLEIYLESGGEINIFPLKRERLHMKPGYYKFSDPLLYNYIQTLLEKYGLPAW